MVICLQRGADCLRMVQLMPLLSQNPIISASFEFRLVVPFWYRLTQVVLDMVIDATTAEKLDGISRGVDANPLPFIFHPFLISHYCSTHVSPIPFLVSSNLAWLSGKALSYSSFLLSSNLARSCYLTGSKAVKRSLLLPYHSAQWVQ